MVKAFKITVNSKTYTIEIEDPWASPASVVVNGRRYQVEVSEASPQTSGQSASRPAPRAAAPAVATPAPQARPSGGQVAAPLPGKIVALSVKVGDRIAPGDEVCKLEAMKMEQSIKSASGGVVRAILVEVGQNVAHGQVLVELEQG